MNRNGEDPPFRLNRVAAQSLRSQYRAPVFPKTKVKCPRRYDFRRGLPVFRPEKFFARLCPCGLAAPRKFQRRSSWRWGRQLTKEAPKKGASFPRFQKNVLWGIKMKGFTRSETRLGLCGLRCGLCRMRLGGYCPGWNRRPGNRASPCGCEKSPT